MSYIIKSNDLVYGTYFKVDDPVKEPYSHKCSPDKVDNCIYEGQRNLITT